MLNLVLGCKINLIDQPEQDCVPEPYCFPKLKELKISAEIKSLLRKGFIEVTSSEQGQFVSNIFSREKPDGSLRIILDLSEFNEHVQYQHFKMDSLQTALNLVTKNCFMASIDWKDAYYSVPVASEYRKFLCFQWQGQLFRYTCLPNGLSEAPRNFTKLAKVLFSELRKLGHLNTDYIDDSLLVGRTVQECRWNVRDTVKFSEKAGFVVHPEKSVLEPSTEISYLGFEISSRAMTVKVTAKQAENIKVACQNLIHKVRVTIQEFARVIGMIVASLPGVQYGPLFYRVCDNYKSKALKFNCGNYSATTVLPLDCLQDLRWWTENIERTNKKIVLPNPQVFLESDASDIGWGGCHITRTGKRKTGGHWKSEESTLHVNEKELLAALFSVQSFCEGMHNMHIELSSDNTTTVAYINNQGGTKQGCNRITREIWLWCYRNDNWISAKHLPGVLNVEADVQSRSIHDNTEWQLHPGLFQKICEAWGTPEIDLFANRLNAQLPVYGSWKPDPGALLTDAMTVDWSQWFFYAFPPFGMVGRVLQKVEHDGACGIVVVPYWPTQHWFSKFTQMCTNVPRVLFSRDLQPVLRHPWRNQEELPNIRFLAAMVSGQRWKSYQWNRPPRTSSWHLGDQLHISSTGHTSSSGVVFVINGERTRCQLI